MAVRTSGTQNVKSNGDQTISAGGLVNVISTASDINLIAAPGGAIVLSQGNSINAVFEGGTRNVGHFEPFNSANPVTTDPTVDQTYFSNTDARKQASAYFAGGVGIEKDLVVGGYIYGRIAEANSTTNIIVSDKNDPVAYRLVFTTPVSTAGSYSLYKDVDSVLPSYAGGSKDYTEKGLVYYPNIVEDGGGVLSTDNLSVGKDINIGGTIYPINEDITGEYLEDLYSKFLDNPAKRNNTLPVGAGMTDMFGELRVRGSNPIGTAPVVTNVLYVTMDGDDTNDGRAQDASRACRSIGGALNSPYYQPGTQIRVSAGHYLEDNPLRLKPYTSIMGSDIRTTGVEPINKTQDLFHLESGCYLAFMQFLNGRSGLLEGAYAPGYNRGAYCTAFPPLTGDDKIDLFHSPYVQNCTNMTGPWLRDGTMFTPNQTVQIPSAVGTGTWAANVSTITVYVSTGTIERGMKINAGNQNQGFFDARTLMLANKPFLQEQVVAFVNDRFPDFEYNQEKCFRDVGILVENAAYDAAFGGNEKSIESGLAYYRGVVSLIAGQEEQTTDAIDYLNSLTQSIILNSTVTDLLSGLGKFDQVRNTVLTSGAIAGDSLTNLFATVTTIIDNGPEAAPSVYKSTGPDAAFVSAEILMQANRKFIQENVINYINNELSYPAKNLKFNKIKCKRDVGLIVDSIALDMLYPTGGHSQSTFAGLQYFTQGSYVDNIPGEITETTAAIAYLKDLAVKVIQNVTPADDLVERYYTGPTTQVTNLEPASDDEIKIIKNNFNIILDIMRGNNLGWTDKIISNGTPIDLQGIRNAVVLLEANKDYMKEEVVAYIESPSGLNFTSYTTATCKRDIGFIVDSISFDLLHGGNRQSVQSGLSYYGFESTRNIREDEKAATITSFNYIAEISRSIIKGETVDPYQTRVGQVILTDTGTDTEADLLLVAVNTVTSIIENGTGTAVWGLIPIATIVETATGLNAFNQLLSNKEFIKEEVIARLDAVYNPNSFNYNEDLCYRDTGLIVDAVSQDILLGGNQKSIEAALSYWNQGYNYVAKQVTTTTMAINYARDVALEVIANRAITTATTVKLQPGTVSTQVINTFFQYGEDYMPQEAVKRNFKIITDVIEKGPSAAPPVYAGGGISPLTGINGLDVKLAPVITSVVENTPGVYTVGLNTSTIGFGTNSTLYFGNTAVFPAQDKDVPDEWAQRRVDPIGAMGGSLVDGAVISSRSPIQSFVYDAYTQVAQGGRGMYITNNGYAQLVSVFTIFCSTGVQTDNGGIASITNSNCNFGDISLLAKGYGKRDFSGTVFNPTFRAYPFSPIGVPGSQELDIYYPNGFWPNRGTVEVFVPDLADRPHIALVMEVEPPDGHLNEQSFPGFLNAQPSTGTLTTSSIVLTNIDTTDVAVGNTVYIRDQYGSEYDDNGAWYASTGTIVTDIGYNAITLNQALTSGGGDATNPNYFTLYFCGNSYYTVLSSTVANSPYVPDTNILDQNLDPMYQGPTTPGQRAAHVASLEHLNYVVNDIIANNTVTPTLGNTATQVILPLVNGGENAQAFIDLRFGIVEDIIDPTRQGLPDTIDSAKSIVPSRAITKTGTVVPGAGSAVTLINANKDFLAEEVTAWVHVNYGALFTDPEIAAYIDQKCKRDTKLILTRMVYDLETGGTYNSVYSGLSYWSRPGTHHVVELGEAATRTDLFPDGSNVNFYQRSYISASGYLFEYVGAGTNYGSLPQVGRADPVQSKETVQLNSGKVFFTSTDQNGDFRIGKGLVISQATGVLSGRTFTQSLFANMTPFILAIEG